jgi:hypothetical protein
MAVSDKTSVRVWRFRDDDEVKAAAKERGLIAPYVDTFGMVTGVNLDMREVVYMGWIV